MKETDLGPPMVEWLQQQGYEVYQEVRLGGMGMPIIDLIGIKDKVIHAVELKTTLSLAVLSQADYNNNYVAFSSVAVPMARRKYGDDKRPRKFAEGVCRDKGIGLFYINMTGEDIATHYIVEAVPSQENPLGPKMLDHVLGLLHENHKVTSDNSNIVAGSKGGGYHTPYKEMIAIVKDYINNHPGVTIGEVMSHLFEMHRTEQISYVPLQPSLMVNLKKIENWCICKKRGNRNYYYVR